ncbi:hypothetical protein LguiA_035278 [Lonicera macranthoides]
MASLPESVLAGVASGSSSFFSVQPPNAMLTGLQSATVDELIHLLTKHQYREEAISILSKIEVNLICAVKDLRSDQWDDGDEEMRTELAVGPSGQWMLSWLWVGPQSVTWPVNKGIILPSRASNSSHQNPGKITTQQCPQDRPPLVNAHLEIHSISPYSRNLHNYLDRTPGALPNSSQLYRVQLSVLLHKYVDSPSTFDINCYACQHLGSGPPVRAHSNNIVPNLNTFGSQRRERYTELGITLWNSKDIVIILLQELTSIYKMLSPGQLSIKDSNRVCNALALLQNMASHPDVKLPFINARIPLYIYHFLNTASTERPFEYLRLTSLGVIGALVKVEDSNSPQVIHFLLESEVLPLCLRCMDWGDELSKTVSSTISQSHTNISSEIVATFILSRILVHEEGLSYCCASAERFYAVTHVMKCMIEKMGNVPLVRLLKHIIHCYLSLSEMPRACDALQHCLPLKLKDHGFINVFVWIQHKGVTRCMLLAGPFFRLSLKTLYFMHGNVHE